MRRFALAVVVALFACALVTSNSGATDMADDASIGSRLEARGTPFVIDDDGDFKITVSFSEEDRTQLVFVSGTTEELAGLTVREIFSPAAELGVAGLDAVQANNLLRGNSQQKLGGWELRGNQLYYTVKVSDNIGAATLDDLVDLVAGVADNMEMEFTGDKDAL